MSERRRKRRKYVVGFDYEEGCLYGPDYPTGEASFTEALLLRDARKSLSQLSGNKGTAVAIYELVPVVRQRL